MNKSPLSPQPWSIHSSVEDRIHIKDCYNKTLFICKGATSEDVKAVILLPQILFCLKKCQVVAEGLIGLTTELNHEHPLEDEVQKVLNSINQILILIEK